MKKFELTENCKIYNQKKLFQIRALRDLDCGVKAGDFGGYVENECNLDQFGDSWVFSNALIGGNACVGGTAQVGGDARVFSNDDILQITGLGTYGRTTTAFNTRSGVHVNCGCFRGDINQFRKRVEQTRDGKVRAEYLKFAELVEIYFSKGENA